MLEQRCLRAVIWDVDGTLVDTAELHFSAWKTVAARLALPFTRQDFDTTFGRRNPEIIQEVFGPGLSADRVAELADAKEELYRAAARRGVDLLPGARALLKGLHEVGIKQAIGSSAPRANIDLLLRVTAIAQYFSAVVSAEDTQRGKPDPQVFEVAAAKLGVPAERCLVIEDAPAGVQAAKNGRMKCVAVEGGGRHSAAALRQAGADLVFESLTQVDAPQIKNLLQNQAM
jgi:beta-phosphoglucomutase